MARTMTGAAVSRVNTRFLLLALILAVLSAVLVYAAISKSGGGGSSGEDVSVVYASEEIKAGTQLTADMLTVREVSADSVGEGYFSSIEAAVGQTVRHPLVANEPVLSSNVVDTAITSNDAIVYVVEPGMRGVAINVDTVIGVSGLLLPGDHVDVLWIPFSGAPSFLLLSDVEVTAVEQTIVDVAPAAPGQTEGEKQEQPAGGSEGDRVRAADGEAQPGASTVTLMLTLAQSQLTHCAEDFASGNGGSIRLAVRSFGDTAPATPNASPCPAPLPEQGQAQ